MQPVNQRNHRVDDVSPQSLGHLVGQHGVRAQLAVALEAAWADGRRLEHAMLSGPPGLGKRQAAAVAAAEMACAFHDVSAESIGDASDLNALLLSACDREIVHIGDAHGLTGPLQAALLLAIDRRVVLLDAEVCPDPLAVSDFSLLLSTTDESELLRPLRDRMSLHLRFDWYAADDLAEIVRRRARALGWQADDDVAPLIAQRARGTPRAALTLLQATYRCARAAGEHALTALHLHQACEVAQIDPWGWAAPNSLTSSCCSKARCASTRSRCGSNCRRGRPRRALRPCWSATSSRNASTAAGDDLSTPAGPTSC